MTIEEYLHKESNRANDCATTTEMCHNEGAAYYRGRRDAMEDVRNRLSDFQYEGIIKGFVELTGAETIKQYKRLFNIERISLIYQDTEDWHTTIVVDGKCHHVKESYEEVKKLIEEANT